MVEKIATSLNQLPNDNKTSWNEQIIAKTKWCHFLQSSEWADVKSNTTWLARQEKVKIKNQEIPCIIYSRSWPALGRVYYLPKLATLNPGDVASFTLNIKNTVKTGVVIRLEIDQPYSDSLHKALLTAKWHQTTAIQYAETVLIDLNRPTDEILNSFKKRARWEIKAAKRRGITVEKVACTPKNLDIFFNMLHITSLRGNFTTRSQKFSKQYWKLLAERGIGQLYFAFHDGDVLSIAYIIKIGKRGFYKDGASTRLKPNLFASRYMQWVIMQDLQKQGCDIYDMCGVPIAEHMDSGNRGIYLFKTAFGDVSRLQGSYVLPLSNRRYKTWAKVEPSLLKLYLIGRKDLWY